MGKGNNSFETVCALLSFPFQAQRTWLHSTTTCSNSQESQETKTFVAISSRKKPASFIMYTAENTFSQQAILLQILQLDLRIKCGILHLLHKSSYKIQKTANVIIHDFMWVMVLCFIFLFWFCTLAMLISSNS